MAPVISIAIKIQNLVPFYFVLFFYILYVNPNSFVKIVCLRRLSHHI